MEQLQELKELVLELEKDLIKCYNKNNVSAGIRARKILQDIKSITKTLRAEISLQNKENIKIKQNKKVK